MQVSLDAEQWMVRDDVSLLEALAQVSDKARAKGRIVTSLKVGGQYCTDRDLVPKFLSRTGSEAGTIEATSASTGDILMGAKESIDKFGAILRQEGEALAAIMRGGAINMSSVDHWLGQLADYLEITERVAQQRLPGYSSDSLVPWVRLFVEARNVPDIVSMADLLEYELLPRIRRS
jgi:hypothetical protein